jgi:pimeloyl-ACP methyl ester carboxylesterase
MAMRLQHDHRGTGEPLVLMHGIGHNRGGWTPVTARISSRREVYAVDLPGFGRSPSLRDREPTVAALADAVRMFMAEQGHETFHAVGNSLGGGIALELGRRGWARSVCAISPIGFAAGRERTYAQVTLKTMHAMASALDPVAYASYGGPARRTVLGSLIFARPWRVPAAAGAHMNHTTARAPGWAATLPAVTSWTPAMPGCPTTIAWGQHDRLLLTSRQAPRAQRRLPLARHVRLHGCGHVPMWDDPEQVAGAILDAGA